MNILAASVFAYILIAGQVWSCPYLKEDQTETEIQTMETALRGRLIQDDIAHTQGMMLTV